MRSLLLLTLVACSAESTVDYTADPDAWFPPPTPCAPGAQAMYDGGAYTLLSDALADAITPMSVVTICRGVHMGGFRTAGPGPLWLAGETGDPADVALDGGQAEGVLFTDGPAMVLRVTGLTVRNGLADPRNNGHFFAGIGQLSADGQLIVQGCAIVDNVSRSDPAGGLDTLASRVLVEDTTFAGNRGQIAGAASVTHVRRGAVITFRDTTFRDNHGSLAGALNVQGGTNQPPPGKDRYNLERVRVLQNDGGSIGGVRFAPVHPVDVRVVDSELSHNTSTGTIGSAGALDMFRFGADRDQRLTILRSQITDNTAAGPAISLGGGFHDPLATAMVGYTDILRNQSTNPGAVSVGSEWGLAMLDVNLGSGADDNTGDVVGCATPLGAGTRGRVVPGQGDVCP